MTEGAPHEYKEQVGTCVDCGNSPVNHFEHFVSNTLAVWTAESVSRKRGARSRARVWSHQAFDRFEQVFLKTLALMPFASFSKDISKARTYRSQVVWEEAQRRGIAMEQMKLFGHGTEIYRARIDGEWFYFQSIPVPTAKRSASAGWVDDKVVLKRALADADVEVPISFSTRTLKEALDAFDEIGGPVVVKPRSGSRGRHTTVRVVTTTDLIEAYASARKLCAYVVVEQYVAGPVCRATLVDGVLRGFFEAKAPTVRGDGRSTVEALIHKANAEKPERVQDIVLTQEHHRYLGRLGLSASSVIDSGGEVALTHRTGRLFGGETRELLGSEHPELRAALEHAANNIGLPVIGFDLIVPDATAHPDSQVWGIIEANSLPYIDLHYLPLHGTPSNVAASVWDMWDTPVHMHAVHAREEGVTIQI